MKSQKQLTKSISIIIPIYNEEKTIMATLKNILFIFQQHKINFEIIIIIDIAPNDNSLKIIKSLSAQYDEIKYFSRTGKQGIASAIYLGIENSQNELIMIVMGDSSEDPLDLVNMIKKMSEGYDMVFANRFSKGSKFKDYPKNKLLANRLCNNTIKFLFGINSKDITNAVKVYRTIFLKQIQITSEGFEIFVELPIKSYLLGAKKFADIPAHHYAGDPSLSKFNLYTEGPRYFKMVANCFFRRNISK
jgi:glycosyltransferase involved in cell wall biosynthesis